METCKFWNEHKIQLKKTFQWPNFSEEKYRRNDLSSGRDQPGCVIKKESFSTDERPQVPPFRRSPRRSHVRLSDLPLWVQVMNYAIVLTINFLLIIYGILESSLIFLWKSFNFTLLKSIYFFKDCLIEIRKLFMKEKRKFIKQATARMLPLKF